MQDSSIWIEKFRPRRFEDIVGQEVIVKRIKAFVESKNLPHLLLAGPPGVGKSTIALVIAKELFGENWRENFLELNASNDRGIDVVNRARQVIIINLDLDRQANGKSRGVHIGNRGPDTKRAEIGNARHRVAFANGRAFLGNHPGKNAVALGAGARQIQLAPQLGFLVLQYFHFERQSLQLRLQGMLVILDGILQLL